MTVEFEHPDGIPCLVLCDSVPRIGECITLTIYEGDSEPATKQTYPVVDVEYGWRGALVTRGGHAMFSQGNVIVRLGAPR